jgi:hypothetical protein
MILTTPQCDNGGAADDGYSMFLESTFGRSEAEPIVRAYII